MIVREYYSRIQQMILDDGKTWDLSPKDKEALHFVLGLVNSMASELADMIGLSVPTIIGRHGKFVESAQARFGTGIGRATWSTGDEVQYQSGAFTITETDGASNP